MDLGFACCLVGLLCLFFGLENVNFRARGGLQIGPAAAQFRILNLQTHGWGARGILYIPEDKM
jgi:hypothetical protein